MAATSSAAAGGAVSSSAAAAGKEPLFIHSESKEPMEFFLRGVSDTAKHTMARFITNHGGKVVTGFKAQAINLVSQSQQTHYRNGRFYSPAFVTESVAAGKLLPLEKYRLHPVKHVGSEKRKREKYTEADDLLILEYVGQSPLSPGGKVLWQEFEKLGVLPHSWQSMHDRYRKSLAKLSKADKSRMKERLERQKLKLHATSSSDPGSSPPAAQKRSAAPSDAAAQTNAGADAEAGAGAGAPSAKRKRKVTDATTPTVPSAVDPVKPPANSPSEEKVPEYAHVPDQEALDLFHQTTPGVYFKGDAAASEADVQTVRQFLMRATGLSEVVVIHALIVQSGNVQRALAYLRLGLHGKGGAWPALGIRPWSFHEDTQLTKTDPGQLPNRSAEDMAAREEYLAS